MSDTTQTPADNRQTPEQAYEHWRNHRINRQAAVSIRDYSEADNYKKHEVAAAIAFVRACLPPQASTGREWERECEVLPSGDYPGMFFVTDNDFYNMKFLHPDGRWRCGMSGTESRFLSADAARAALAQAPDPRTPQASPASDKGKPLDIDSLPHDAASVLRAAMKAEAGRSSYPPPASYKGHPDTINPVADPDFVARMPAPPPASGEQSGRCTCQKHERGDDEHSPDCGTSIPPNHRVEAANDAYTLASPVETPATVPVPLELAREIVDRDFSVRRHLESDHPHARLYDTLAAGVKEADRGK